MHLWGQITKYTDTKGMKGSKWLSLLAKQSRNVSKYSMKFGYCKPFSSLWTAGTTTAHSFFCRDLLRLIKQTKQNVILFFRLVPHPRFPTLCNSQCTWRDQEGPSLPRLSSLQQKLPNTDSCSSQLLTWLGVKDKVVWKKRNANTSRLKATLQKKVNKTSRCQVHAESLSKSTKRKPCKWNWENLKIPLLIIYYCQHWSKNCNRFCLEAN